MSTAIELRKLGPNVTQLVVADGRILLFSYNTLVAAQLPSGYVRTSKRWSNTTTKHINKWLGGLPAISMSQDELEAVCAGGK